MKSWIKIIFLTVCLLATVNLIACSTKKEEKVDTKSIPKYSEVTAVENNNGDFSTFKIENKTVVSIGSADKIENIVYDTKNSTYVHSITVSQGKNMNGSVIDINVSGKKNQLKDFYAAVDLKLNNNGDKLAFRTFKSDSLESAEGMKIYDVKNSKYLQLKSQVLVSGNIYQWIDDNKIIYYGSMEGKKNSQKIYMYDFKKNKEEIYVNSIDGYCMNFIPMKNKLLILARKGDKEQLYYYDKENGNTKIISSNIKEMYNSITNNKKEEAFFYGSEDENTKALYMFSYKDFSLNRITYDFPKQVDISSGIAVDSEENVYFCGVEDAKEYNKKDIFMYDIKENSINLISQEASNYSVYSDIKNQQ